MRGCQMPPQAIGFILFKTQQRILFSPSKTKKTKEEHIECYLEMNQLYKPKSFSLPCSGMAGAVCNRLQHSTQSLLPPTPTPPWGLPVGTQHPDCIRAESRDPPVRLLLGTAAGADLSPSPALL